MVNTTNRYDEIVYPSYTHPQTHPDRLATIGTLFGLQPAPVTHCRVLELGCGNGSNLLPMATSLPNSKFVGIDLAASPINQGQQTIKDLGLKNLELIHTSVTQLGEREGRFDYIIAHGLFSWVPLEVREHIFRVCRQLLQPHGIAFISYNALPGAQLRNMVREMMLFHVRGIENPQERIRQAQAVVRFIAGAQDTKDEYRLWMKTELESILGHEEGHLYHDELAEISEPYYFTQFIQKAGEHGLKFLGEADYFEMFDHCFKPDTRQSLKQLGHNRILHEQYLDFLKCRRFRQTLLCHEEAPLDSEPNPEKITQLLLASTAKITNGVTALDPGKTITYATPKGANCATDFPLGKAALACLIASLGIPLNFESLHSAARLRLANAGVVTEEGEQPRMKLAGFMLELHAAGLVEVRSWLPAFTQRVSYQPAVSALVRWQVQRGNFVTSQFHQAVKVEDEIVRLLLSSLDGTLDHAALVEKILDLLKSKNTQTTSSEDAVTVRQKISIHLQTNLEQLARLGLLVS